MRFARKTTRPLRLGSVAALLIAELGACVLPEVSAAPEAPLEPQPQVESSAPNVEAAPSSTPAGDPVVVTTQSEPPDGGAADPMISVPEAPPVSSPPPPAAAGPSPSCPSSSCQIDGECFDANTPRPRTPCEYCDPAKTRTAWTERAEGTTCDDGMYCNGTGRCRGASSNRTCVTEDRPCPENGDACRTCNNGLKECGYATASWIWTDPTSNLQWQLKATEPATQMGAQSICADLLLCGESDWHLATIDELRTLVRRCPATEPQGACGVTDACTSFNECRSDSCDGCGASANQLDWFCPDELDIVYAGIMSSTPSELESAWKLDCGTGEINTLRADTFTHGRCVRNAL